MWEARDVGGTSIFISHRFLRVSIPNLRPPKAINYVYSQIPQALRCTTAEIFTIFLLCGQSRDMLHDTDWLVGTRPLTYRDRAVALPVVSIQFLEAQSTKHKVRTQQHLSKTFLALWFVLVFLFPLIEDESLGKGAPLKAFHFAIYDYIASVIYWQVLRGHWV